MTEQQELKMLAAQFYREADEVSSRVKQLSDILSTLTAENCPLSPCGDCILVHCMLRRTNK